MPRICRTLLVLGLLCTLGAGLAHAQSLSISNARATAGGSGSQQIFYRPVEGAEQTFARVAKLSFDLNFNPGIVGFTALTTSTALAFDHRVLTYKRPSPGRISVTISGRKKPHKHGEEERAKNDDGQGENEDEDDSFVLETIELADFKFTIPAAAPAQEQTVTLDNVRFVSPSGRVTLGAAATATITIVRPMPLPLLTLTAPALDFGDVVIGSSKDLTVTLQETAGVTATISNVRVGGSSEFSLSSQLTMPVSVRPGGTFQVSARFQPTVTGTASAALDIFTDAQDSEISLALTGNGKLAASTSGSAGTTSPLSGVALGKLAVTGIDFGNVPVGDSETGMFRIFSVGTAPLAVSAIALTTGEFRLMGSPKLPWTIAAGSSAAVSVAFSPTATGPASASVHLASNSSTPLATVSLSGAGIAAPAIGPKLTATDAQVKGGTTGTVDVSLVNFGDTLVSSVSFDLMTSGTGVMVTGVTVGSSASAENKTVTTAPITGGLHVTIAGMTQLAIGDGSILLIAFKADQQNGTFPITLSHITFTTRAILSIAASGPVTANVTVTVSPPPHLSVSPLALNFGLVTIGSVATKGVVVENTGGGLLQVGGLTLTTTSSAYALASGTHAFSLAAGAGTTLEVTFSPKDTGIFSASLAMTGSSSSTASRTVTVPIQGLAIPSSNAIVVLPGEIVLIGPDNNLTIFGPGTAISLIFTGLRALEGQTLHLQFSGSLNFSGTLDVEGTVVNGEVDFLLKLPRIDVNGTLVLKTQAGAPLQTNQLKSKGSNPTAGTGTGGSASTSTGSSSSAAQPIGTNASASVATGTQVATGSDKTKPATMAAAACSMSSPGGPLAVDLWLWTILGALTAWMFGRTRSIRRSV